MSETTVTLVTYGAGGCDASQPHNNAVEILEQQIDEDGNPVGEPTIVYQAAEGS